VQLDKKGIVVPGQCLPATDGWRLIEYDNEDKSEVVVFSGFYDHCRRIQKSMSECPNADLASELDQLRAEAERRRAANSSFLKKLARRKDTPDI